MNKGHYLLLALVGFLTIVSCSGENRSESKAIKDEVNNKVSFKEKVYEFMNVEEGSYLKLTFIYSDTVINNHTYQFAFNKKENEGAFFIDGIYKCDLPFYAEDFSFIQVKDFTGDGNQDFVVKYGYSGGRVSEWPYFVQVISFMPKSDSLNTIFEFQTNGIYYKHNETFDETGVDTVYYSELNIEGDVLAFSGIIDGVRDSSVIFKYSSDSSRFVPTNE